MQVLVRPDVVHELAAIRQRFVGAITVVEPGVFAAAARQLIAELPLAQDAAETVILWNCVMPTLFRGAVMHHELFHRCFGEPCVFTPPWPYAVTRFEQTTLTRQMAHWLVAQESAFDSVHRWPAAVRAAVIVQRDPGHNWYISELAKAVGASASTLQRGFQQVYGIRPQRYQMLVRLRSAAAELRNDSGCVESVLLNGGCHSVRNAYRTFRQWTGITLADVRRLTDDQFCRLMNGPLAVPPPNYANSTHLAPIPG